MAVVLQSMNRRTAALQEKIEKANEAMKNLKMPQSIKEEVDFYLNHTQNSLDLQEELDSFLRVLSPSLKKKVSAYIFHDVILLNPAFQGHEEVLKLVLQDVVTKLYLPENEIIRQNDTGDSMFFLARGE